MLSEVQAAERLYVAAKHHFAAGSRRKTARMLYPSRCERLSRCQGLFDAGRNRLGALGICADSGTTAGFVQRAVG
jgi:hypothetical protein